MFGDRLSPILSLTAAERARLRALDPSPAQRERLLILAVSGEPEGPALMRAKTRLAFGYELAQTGRIGEGTDA